MSLTLRSRRRSSPPWTPLVAFCAFAATVGSAQAEGIEPEDELDDRKIVFEASTVEAHPGEQVKASIRVHARVGLSLAAFSLKYDVNTWNVSTPVLSPEVQEIVDRNPMSSEFLSDLDDITGWVQASVITDFSGRQEYSIPAGGSELVTLGIEVKQNTPAGTYPIHFGRGEDDDEEDEFESEFRDSLGSPIYNHTRREGTEIEDGAEYDDDGDEIELKDGAVIVSILGDVNVFARGDANADRKLDISDPVTILSFLFLGINNVTCQDACDSNDDGNVDLSDSVTLLNFLFVPGDSSVTLSTQLVSDLSPDNLGCIYY